jgi:hypothetical protein
MYEHRFAQAGQDMTPQTKDELAAQQVRDLAERIYVELSCRLMLETRAGDQPKPSPEDMAKLSFKLAHIFQEVEREVKAAKSATTDGYELTVSAMADWKK